MEISKKLHEYDKMISKSKKELDQMYERSIPVIANLANQDVQLEMKKQNFYKMFSQKENEIKETKSSNRSIRTNFWKNFSLFQSH